VDGMNVPPRLSVLISTFNRRDVLVSRTLPAIFGQDLPADNYEVIVIVDGSTDGTAAALRELRPSCALRVLEQPNRGPSAARNAGMRMVRGELVLFLDDDILCSPDVFKLHVEAHDGPGPVVAHGTILLAPGSPPSILTNANASWYQKHNARLARQGGLEWPDATYLISNSSMPRGLLLECGGLEEELPAMEDFELGLRLWKRGVQFRYIPAAVTYEISVKSWRRFLFNDGNAFGKSEVWLCRKYPDYRPRSPLLSGLGRTARWKRVIRRMALQSPVSLAHLLVPPIWLCNALCRFPAAQKVGLRLLEIGRRITELRAALEAAGSWNGFHREYET
jgi:glycosyltransferase involved in cell wall biosynthesis